MSLTYLETGEFEAAQPVVDRWMCTFYVTENNEMISTIIMCVIYNCGFVMLWFCKFELFTIIYIVQLTTVISAGLRAFLDSIDESAWQARGYAAAPLRDNVIGVTSKPL